MTHCKNHSNPKRKKKWNNRSELYERLNRGTNKTDYN